jgi:Na+/H+ antiporter NhaD/arsenite permease-like protein
MSLALDTSAPEPDPDEVEVEIKQGAIFISVLFLFTIAMTVALHSFLHLPPALGMMTGLGLLKLYSSALSRRPRHGDEQAVQTDGSGVLSATSYSAETDDKLDIFHIMTRFEWDTMMFFYGIILCVGAIDKLGYLSSLSELLYSGLGTTAANISVGLLSAVLDNIPIMFGVLSMNPEMSHWQWLLVTLTAGVGGSLLSIGSAAGVALMGQSQGKYGFFSHLRWSWAILLGYAGSIAVHLALK